MGDRGELDVGLTEAEIGLKKKDHSFVGLALEIVMEEPEFLRAPTRSDPQDGLGTHFPKPKVIITLKRIALEK